MSPQMVCRDLTQAGSRYFALSEKGNGAQGAASSMRLGIVTLRREPGAVPPETNTMGCRGGQEQ